MLHLYPRRWPPASTCHVEASSGSHIFKIAGYSLTQGMGVGHCLQSSAFTVAGHDWAVVFYPDGHGVNESADHVSVFVTLLIRQARRTRTAATAAPSAPTSTSAWSTSGAARR
ncbi:hypothetical protein GQ55_5G051700 [Panicum hallii var. hallii]|uniref:MATH domain-containing protein n=2 Tax=Panicum hallii TaxID=206008 RepID=A0A2T7DCY1_9POAL|nr:hypothetical protein GQ55_5G051700 [Panicum hallii var. hallii]PVH37651.1 hypothetical protein PAHAL_5G053000 [Panicum hallii]